jgi:hypothetical protein
MIVPGREKREMRKDGVRGKGMIGAHRWQHLE